MKHGLNSSAAFRGNEGIELMAGNTLSKLSALVRGGSSAAALASVPAVSAPAADAPAPAAGADAPTLDITAMVAEAEQEGYADGYAAANARTFAVLRSEPGQANMSNALFLLEHSQASADQIIAQLSAAAPAPAPAAAAPAAPAAEAPLSPADKLAAATPPVDLGAATGDGGNDAPAEDIWEPTLKQANQESSLSAGGIFHSFGAAKAPAGMEGISHGC